MSTPAEEIILRTLWGLRAFRESFLDSHKALVRNTSSDERAAMLRVQRGLARAFSGIRSRRQKTTTPQDKQKHKPKHRHKQKKKQIDKDTDTDVDADTNTIQSNDYIDVEKTGTNTVSINSHTSTSPTSTTTSTTTDAVARLDVLPLISMLNRVYTQTLDGRTESCSFLYDMLFLLYNPPSENEESVKISLQGFGFDGKASRAHTFVVDDRLQHVGGQRNSQRRKVSTRKRSRETWELANIFRHEVTAKWVAPTNVASLNVLEQNELERKSQQEHRTLSHRTSKQLDKAKGCLLPDQCFRFWHVIDVTTMLDLHDELSRQESRESMSDENKEKEEDEVVWKHALVKSETPSNRSSNGDTTITAAAAAAERQGEVISSAEKQDAEARLTTKNGDEETSTSAVSNENDGTMATKRTKDKDNNSTSTGNDDIDSGRGRGSGSGSGSGSSSNNKSNSSTSSSFCFSGREEIVERIVKSSSTSSSSSSSKRRIRGHGDLGHVMRELLELEAYVEKVKVGTMERSSARPVFQLSMRPDVFCIRLEWPSAHLLRSARMSDVGRKLLFDTISMNHLHLYEVFDVIGGKRKDNRTPYNTVACTYTMTHVMCSSLGMNVLNPSNNKAAHYKMNNGKDSKKKHKKKKTTYYGMARVRKNKNVAEEKDEWNIIPLGGDKEQDAIKAPKSEAISISDLQKLCKERKIFPEFLFFESNGPTQRDLKSKEREYRVSSSTMMAPPPEPSSVSRTSAHQNYYNYGTLSKGKEDQDGGAEGYNNNQVYHEALPFSHIDTNGQWCEGIGCILS
jgi:hypothetical protein